MAENEVSANKHFMQTTGKQIDDVAWTLGRTQTVSYSSKYLEVKFQEESFDYISVFKMQMVHGKTYYVLARHNCNL